MQRLTRIASVALITAGLVVLADVAITLAWKEPVSSLYGSIQQGRLSDELEGIEDEFPARSDLRAIGRAGGLAEQARLLADRFEGRLEAGEAIGRIAIPAIDADYVLVEGTDTGTLQRGPGHYPDTRLPGQGGTAGIAGHRTTYLAPFRPIDDLGAGDEVIVEMPYATFVYEVEGSEVVEPSEVEIVADEGYERVVLTACHPLYSAAKRYAVFARLERITLFAAGEKPIPDP